ncbi:MAG: hypothetical protein JXD19_05240 [Deltaproteobacteria bacterium]|nr:hypothetical protein [Deltaproteobacteria bacterium]
MYRIFKTFFIISAVIGCFLPGICKGYEAYIPHISGGNTTWVDYLQVDNNKLSLASFSLILYADGSQIYQADFTVEGLSERLLPLKDLATNAQCGIIIYSDPQLNFRLSYEHLTGGGVAEFRLNDESYSTLGCYFSDIGSDISWKGIALTNMSSVAANVTLYAVGGGSILDSAPIQINPYSKAVGLYQAWFPTLDFAAVNKIIAVSTGNICGVVISGTNDYSRLLFTAGAEVSGFDPGLTPQIDITGTWRGTWRSYDSGAGNVILQITQSGNVLSGTITITNTGCGAVQNIPATGTISGTAVDFIFAFNCGAQGIITNYATGIVVGNVVSGTYYNDLNGYPYDEGTFTYTKQ